MLTRRQKIWARSDRRMQRLRTLTDLRNLEPVEFERLVARLFSQQDEYMGTPVGGSGDDGIDVRIFTSDGALWAVAQCKRYGSRNRVSSSEIRDFAGAYMLSGAERGFFFTTGSFTHAARRTADAYKWLETYNGPRLVDYIATRDAQLDGLDGVPATQSRGIDSGKS
ncbi:restriction endonuclease [Allorhodopirellula solitaria]|uniref:restriction endonuclease n=1 Tax=Allorhodopirellula solitaria TaxID=2527987 RepID=UPI001FEA0EC5|nr:restriction endonuclease [Allorhodopirellula solitaria]